MTTDLPASFPAFVSLAFLASATTLGVLALILVSILFPLAPGPWPLAPLLHLLHLLHLPLRLPSLSLLRVLAASRSTYGELSVFIATPIPLSATSFGNLVIGHRLLRDPLQPGLRGR